ncbi:MAG: RDD family protein [Pseudomonadales bacterium]|jgi:uncharacterized RDD family membrane protein YckC|nr:RDD family protein [Pseudomonadales bacterium]
MTSEVEYAGFWIRTAASIIDTLLITVVIGPLLTAIYGTDYWLSTSEVKGTWDVLLNYIFPAAAIIVFWVCKSATPGKMLLKLKVVNATTGGKPSTGQFIGRYLGYYVADIALLLGIFWVGIDKRKQGWHEKLAGILVTRQTDS